VADPAPAKAAEAAAPEEPKKQPERSRQGGGRDRNRGDRSRGKDEPVIGMGDHLPTFIAKSFEERQSR
ncbi:hypothetical protein LCGC14_2708510, partial [marine sediment metagenome]